MPTWWVAGSLTLFCSHHHSKVAFRSGAGRVHTHDRHLGTATWAPPPGHRHLVTATWAPPPGHRHLLVTAAGYRHLVTAAGYRHWATATCHRHLPPPPATATATCHRHLPPPPATATPTATAAAGAPPLVPAAGSRRWLPPLVTAAGYRHWGTATGAPPLVTADIVICLTEIVFCSSCASTEAERAGHPPGGQGLRGTVESAQFKGPKLGIRAVATSAPPQAQVARASGWSGRLPTAVGRRGPLARCRAKLLSIT